MSTLRDALATAMTGQEDEVEPVADLESLGQDEPVAAESTEPAEPTESAEPAPSSESEKVRDALGRFVPKAAAAEPAVPVDPSAVAAPVDSVAPTTPEDRAPASWSPAAREEWKAIGPVARAEVMKREQEVQRVLQESSTARDVAQELMSVCTPHMSRIRSRGVSPLQAIAGLFDTEAELSSGGPVQKAETIARLVKAYGVDIAALDSALAGAAPPQEASVQGLVQEMLQRELAPIRQMMTAAQARSLEAQAKNQEAAQSDIDTFASDPKNEFFNDVRETMADIIEVASKRGVFLPLKDAYSQAIQLTPSVREVLNARTQRSSAQNVVVAAQRARRAAVSVSGAPVMADLATPPDDLRGALAAAFDANSRV